MKFLPKARVHIASAGYGLLDSDDLVRPYSATFTKGDPDSIPQLVGDYLESCRQWWLELAGSNWWRRLVDDEIVVAQLSQAYLKVLEPGLLKLADHMQGRFALIAPACDSLPDPLAKALLPIDTRVEHLVPTTRGDAGAAGLLWLVRRHDPENGWDLERIRVDCAEVMASLPPMRQYDRRKLSQGELLAFIAKEAVQLSRPSASSLLRKLRDAGYACEQGRFRALFQRWQEQQDTG